LFFAFAVFALLCLLFQSTSYTFVSHDRITALKQQTGIAQNAVPPDERVWTPETDLTLEAPHVRKKAIPMDECDADRQSK